MSRLSSIFIFILLMAFSSINAQKIKGEIVVSLTGKGDFRILYKSCKRRIYSQSSIIKSGLFYAVEKMREFIIVLKNSI